MKSLLEDGHSADAIFQALSTQQTELVLTAHPTEVNRRTILEKQRRVQNVSISRINPYLLAILLLPNIVAHTQC
jgi:phosphoenolpyruvate carboxylase